MAETVDIQRLIVSMEANFKKYENALNKATSDSSNAAKRIEDRFDKMGAGLASGFAAAGRHLLGLAAGAITVQKATEIIGGAVTEFAKIGDIAERVNITTDALQALRFIVNQNGGEITDADNAIQKFSQSLGDAARGEGELFKWFEANNIALKDKAGNLRNVDEMLGEFARLVAGAGSQAERMAMSVDAFGRRAGPAMLIALQQIANDGLPEVIRAARQVGVVADESLIAKAKEIDDAWDKLTMQVSTYIRSRILTAASEWEIFMATMSGQALVESIGKFEHAWRNRIGPLTAPPPTPGTTKSPVKPQTGGAGGDTKDAFDRQVDSINKHITAMLADAAAVGLNKSAHEQLKAEMTLLEAARRGDVEVTDDQIAKYAQLRVTMSAQQALAGAGISLSEQQVAALTRLGDRASSAAGKLDSVQRSFRGINEAAQFAGDTIVTALENIIDGADAGTVALRALRHALLQAVISGQGPLAQILGLASSVSGGTGGLIGLLTSGLPGKASGGPVSANRPILVGERGPEILIPKAAGVVVPNHAIRGGSGGSGLVVSMPVSIHAPGADAAKLSSLVDEVKTLQRTLPKQVGAIVQRRQTRNTRWG